MKLLFSILAFAFALTCHAVEKQSVMVFTNGGIYSPSNLWAANAAGINAVVVHPESGSSNSIINCINSLNLPAILDGFHMAPAVSSTSTNTYWWDFGKTNALGQKLIYATLNATNTVNFVGPTNAQMWGLLSMGVYANGGNRTILFPSNLPLLRTNSMTLTNGVYVMTLTNSTLLRLTLQSNEFGLEPQWVVKP